VPGIYINAIEALESVCDVEGAHAQRFPSLVTAISAWREALANGEVVPLGDIMPWQLGSHYSLSGWVTLGCSQKEVLRNKQEPHVGGCHMEKCLPHHWKLAKVMNGVERPMSMGQSGLFGRAECQGFLIAGKRCFDGMCRALYLSVIV
jgi:hypothetical protein